MKQLPIILFLFFSLFSCQKKTDNISLQSKITIDAEKIKYETVGYSDKYDNLPKLELQEITEQEFNKLNKTKEFLEKKAIQNKGENYYLETEKKILKLKAENKINVDKEGEVWYEYLGFYPSLNMYAVSRNSVSENLNFSDFELINKSNDKVYKIVSPGDDKIENPVPSPQNNYLAYYYNHVYNDNNSFLGILKIDSGKNLKEYGSLISENFEIYQAAWSEDNWILIKVSSDNGKSFKYYKSDILNKQSNETKLISNKWFGTYKTRFSYGKIGGTDAGWDLEIEIRKESIIATGNGYQIGFKDKLIATGNGNELLLKFKKNIEGYSLGENMNPEFTLKEVNGKYYIQSEWIDSDIITKPEKSGFLIEKE